MINDKIIEKYVIVRCKAGIFAGTLQEIEGTTLLLKNSRRLRYWDGAATLSELSQKGVSRPDNCQFPDEIPTEWLSDVFEILLCSEIAQKSIKDVKIWTEH